MKLLQKITLTSTFAFLLCITSKTTTNIPSIITEKEVETFKNIEQNDTNHIESKIQPLSDNEDDTKKETLYPNYLKYLLIFFSSNFRVAYFYYNSLLQYNPAYTKYAQGFPSQEDLFFFPHSTSNHIYFFLHIQNVESIEIVLLSFY